MRTFFLRSEDASKQWYIIDAAGLILGRLAVVIANRLRGKHLPTYTPHTNCGERIIVINATQIALSGNKLKDKVFYWHTGYPGGIKARTAEATLNSNKPERLLMKAVERMIPRGPLGHMIMQNLKVYPGADHPHEAQQPIVLDVGAMNSKNKRR